MKELKGLVRPNVQELSPYASARDVIQKGILLDANEKPFLCSWGNVCLNRYPDPTQRQLRNLLAQYVGVEPANVLAGNGSDEVLDWIFKVFCVPGKDQVAIVDPTYGMYEVLAKIHGVGVTTHFRAPGERLPLEALTLHGSEPAKVIFLCTPNNPTGDLLELDDVRALCGRTPGVVVVDEAYIEFSECPSLAKDAADRVNLIVLRTLSKAFGRAGIRVGYAIAHAEVTNYLFKVKAPYNLNAWNMLAAQEALEAQEEMHDFVRYVRRERSWLSQGLEKIPQVGRVWPSHANFLLFQCPNAAQVCDRLLKQGVVVRDRSALHGLTNHVRVTIGTHDENQKFLTALGEILSEAA